MMFNPSTMFNPSFLSVPGPHYRNGVSLAPAPSTVMGLLLALKYLPGLLEYFRVWLNIISSAGEVFSAALLPGICPGEL